MILQMQYGEVDDMLFKQIDPCVKHDVMKTWYLCRDYEEDITAKWSPFHKAYTCTVSITQYNDRWEEVGYLSSAEVLTDADLGYAEVISMIE